MEGGDREILHMIHMANKSIYFLKTKAFAPNKNDNH